MSACALKALQEKDYDEFEQYVQGYQYKELEFQIRLSVYKVEEVNKHRFTVNAIKAIDYIKAGMYCVEECKGVSQLVRNMLLRIEQFIE